MHCPASAFMIGPDTASAEQQRLDKVAAVSTVPAIARTGWSRDVGQSTHWIGLVGDRIEHSLRQHRPDTWQQQHDAKAGHTVAWVLDEAQQREHILDVRGIEKLQSAEFHERDVVTC